MSRALGCALLLLGLLAGGLVWAADESCSNVQQCSKEIAASDTHSQVRFGFVTSEFCIRNAVGSVNTVYFNTKATATADADQSSPLAPNTTICFSNSHRTNQVNLICAAGETATVQVDAWQP